MNLITNSVTVTRVSAETLTQRLRKVKKIIKPVNVDHLNATSNLRQIIDVIGQQHNDGLRGLFDGQRKHIQGKDSKGRAFIITFHGEENQTCRYEIVTVDALDLNVPVADPFERKPVVALPEAAPAVELDACDEAGLDQDALVFNKALAEHLGTRTFDFNGEQAQNHWHALGAILKKCVAQEPHNARHIVEQGLKDVGLEAYVEKAVLYYDDKVAMFDTNDIVGAAVELVQFLYNVDHNLEGDNGATVSDSAYKLVSTKRPDTIAPAAPVAPSVTVLPTPQETTMNQVTLTKAPRCDIIIPEVTELTLANLEPFGLSEHKDLVETYYRAALQAPTQEQAKMEIDALCSEFMDIGYENIEPFRFESYAMLQAVGKVCGEKPANHPDTTHEAAAVQDRNIEGRTDILDFFDMRKALFAEKYWKVRGRLGKDDHHKIPAAFTERFPVMDLSKDEQRAALMHSFADVPYTPVEGKSFEQAAIFAGTDNANHDYYLENTPDHVRLVVRWTGNRYTDLTLNRKPA